MKSGDSAGPSDDSYTAVVYFHGMGSQRRYVEMSNFVEALEEHDRTLVQEQDGESHFKGITAQLEPSRNDARKNVAYIDLYDTAPREDTTEAQARRFRFYEAYWAPVTAGGAPMYDVLWWMVKQVYNPWRALFSSWRLRGRYRVSTLHAMLRDNADDDADARTLYELLRWYDDFGSSRTRQDDAYKRGVFPQFWRFLRNKIDDRAMRVRCLTLAYRWFNFYVQMELRNAFVLTTLLVTLLTALLILVGSVLGILGWVSTFPFVRVLVPEQAGSFSAWSLIPPILAAAATLFGLRSFFQDYLGDVMFWVTYEETNERHKKRAEILDICVNLMQHVLQDDKCKRVIIVAHSLGTAVAYETLLELGRYNRARYPGTLMQGPPTLAKIEHFITFGSPIDKIHYFFQNYKGEHYRYNQVIERLRGDISTEPLADNWVPHVHWINFWDQADIISGPLQTPYPLAPRRWSYLEHLRVDNVEVANGSFNPMSSHVLYLQNPQVRSLIYACVFERAYYFVPAVAQENVQPGSERSYQFVGPGNTRRSTAFVHIVVLLLSWIAPLAVAGVALSGFVLVPRWLAWLALLVPGLAVLALVSTWAGTGIYMLYVERQIASRARSRTRSGDRRQAADQRGETSDRATR